MMVTCHSNKLESSMRPAEKPSTGFFIRSSRHGVQGWSASYPEARHLVGSPRDRPPRSCLLSSSTAWSAISTVLGAERASRGWTANSASLVARPCGCDGGVGAECLRQKQQQSCLCTGAQARRGQSNGLAR